MKCDDWFTPNQPVPVHVCMRVCAWGVMRQWYLLSMDVKFLLYCPYQWQSKGREMLILKRALLGDKSAQASHFLVCEWGLGQRRGHSNNLYDVFCHTFRRLAMRYSTSNSLWCFDQTVAMIEYFRSFAGIEHHALIVILSKPVNAPRWLHVTLMATIMTV